jgi:hypothetical protein
MKRNNMRDALARWKSICQEQGWNEASKVALLEELIRKHGLEKELLAHGQEAADLENGVDDMGDAV